MKEKIIGLYPMTKFVFIICYMVIGLFIPTIVGRLIWFACLNVVAIMSGTFKEFFKAVYGGVGTLAILMLLMQGLFYPGEKVVLELGSFAFKEEGLLYSVKLSLLLFIIVGAFIWYFKVTTHKEFIYALEDAGLPPKSILHCFSYFTDDSCITEKICYNHERSESKRSRDRRKPLGSYESIYSYTWSISFKLYRQHRGKSINNGGKRFLRTNEKDTLIHIEEEKCG